MLQPHRRMLQPLQPMLVDVCDLAPYIAMAHDAMDQLCGGAEEEARAFLRAVQFRFV